MIPMCKKAPLLRKVPASLAIFLSLAVLAGDPAEATNGDAMMGIPLGATSDEEANLDLCPQGVTTVSEFLQAWQEGNYRAMYDLLDDESKKDYPFETAKLDFQFLEFKEYRISSVRKNGDNFEIMLSYGYWKDGDKDVKKMIISGRTFKIIMPASHSPFKRSAESYF